MEKPNWLSPVALPLSIRKEALFWRAARKVRLPLCASRFFRCSLRQKGYWRGKFNCSAAGGEATIVHSHWFPSSHVHLGLGILAQAFGSRSIHAILSDCTESPDFRQQSRGNIPVKRGNRDMMKMVVTMAAAGFMVAGMAIGAEAMPAAPMPASQGPAITLTAGGCGVGRHRGRYGHCRRNWRPVRHCHWRHTPVGPRRVCHR